MVEATIGVAAEVTIEVAAEVIIGAAVEAKIEVAVETKVGAREAHSYHLSSLTTSTMHLTMISDL